jgi:hypothetical protein
LRKVCAGPNCAVHHPKRQPSKGDAAFKAEREKQRRDEALAQATGLRVMSPPTSEKILVGFALDRRRVSKNLDSEKLTLPRFSRIPTFAKALWPLAMRFASAMLAKKQIVLQSEGLGKRPLHGWIVLLVNRHTASVAELIGAFAREDRLPTIIGEKTAKRLLSATSVKVGNGFRLALPNGAYCITHGRDESLKERPSNLTNGWHSIGEIDAADGIDSWSTQLTIFAIWPLQCLCLNECQGDFALSEINRIG